MTALAWTRSLATPALILAAVSLIIQPLLVISSLTFNSHHSKPWYMLESPETAGLLAYRGCYNAFSREHQRGSPNFWKHSHTAQLPLEHLVDGVPGQVESVKLFLGRRAQQSCEMGQCSRPRA